MISFMDIVYLIDSFAMYSGNWKLPHQQTYYTGCNYIRIRIKVPSSMQNS